jgi:hypothetical protein
VFKKDLLPETSTLLSACCSFLVVFSQSHVFECFVAVPEIQRTNLANTVLLLKV